MSLRRRLEQLEGGHGRECPECGFDGDLSKVEIEVVWEDLDLYEVLEGEEHLDRGQDVDPDLPEYCPECGHQLIYTVTWMDLEEQP